MSIDEFLKANAMTQQDFALGIDEPAQNVSRWVRRAGRPRWPQIKKIKSFTNGAVTADDFLDGPDDGKSPVVQPNEARAS